MSNIEIHPSSVVEAGAKIADGVKIGPFCVVSAQAELGEGCELISHVVVAGRTSIGARTKVYPFASLGHPPQDVKYAGEESTLVIGSDCTIREGVTMNPGTAHGRMTTTVGNHCLFLANSHVAHDCEIGNHVIFSNNVMPAGHCYIGDYVIVGGGAGIHQFARIGAHAFIGGMSAIENDVIPYGMAMGNRAYLAGLNIIGLKRRGFSREEIHELRHAYRLLFANEGTLSERVDDVSAAFSNQKIVAEILEFIRTSKDRSILTPRDSGGASA
ncbi:acyl-ACP--UDP-N-acetylglucosamine O-acyltransferase [Microvirga sp. W0021]|uniref:Acyl-[acyl-carrier-protein]--UDP-N-acetylglucosamine O-acyltransferase n=1 Tax=Hohaiivirga grylli TaxID=3133970 RepID=A0ABV0BKS5_9HYPH